VAAGFKKEIMKTFKTFLTECGVQDADALILFLNNLPDDPDDINTPDIERFKDVIDTVFDEVM
jgi:hypothetical protein